MTGLEKAFPIRVVFVTAIGTALVILVFTRLGGGDQNSNSADLNENEEAKVTNRNFGENNPGRPKHSERGEEKGITPEEARKQLDVALGLSDVTQRSLAAISIIQKLCEAGYTEEAWELIEENPGQVRSSEIARYFKCAGLDTSAFLAKVSQLPYKGESASALRGYFSSLDSAAIQKLLDDSSFKEAIRELDKTSPGILQNSLAGSLMATVAFPGNYSSKTQALDAAKDLHAKGVLNDERYAQIIKADTSGDAFDKFSRLNAGIGDSPRQTEAGKLRKDLVERMVDSDAPRTLERLTSIKGVQGTVDTIVAIRKWGTLDSVEANEWFVNNSNKLSPIHKDAAILGFYRLSLDYNERETAEKWANQITDEGLKKNVLAELAKSKLHLK